MAEGENLEFLSVTENEKGTAVDVALRALGDVGRAVMKAGNQRLNGLILIIDVIDENGKLSNIDVRITGSIPKSVALDALKHSMERFEDI